MMILNMRKTRLLMLASAFGITGLSYALPLSSENTPEQHNDINNEAKPTTAPHTQIVPSKNINLSFAQISQNKVPIHLRGSHPEGRAEFGVRGDNLVSSAMLDLEFTPSPSLLPVESQLKVFLNDELMGVIPIQKEDLGKKTRASLPVDTRYIKDFNQIRMEFVGHYRDICENPANTTLWLDISQNSHLNMQVQPLVLKNELSRFPVPFFDARDQDGLTLPIVFGESASLKQQNAAAILTSWFGTKTQWRNQNYPVLMNQLPDQHSIIFMTNDNRPSFLADFPPVKGPMVEIISHPDNPYIKLLLIQGRNDDDLIQAAKGIGQGELLLRGSAVSVDNIEALAPRVPYDAPNWVKTDKPVTFAELVTFKGQLQSAGLNPYPIVLDLNLPPDLFTFRNSGIEMRLNYRYTAPNSDDGSKMTINVNNEIIQSQPLLPNKKDPSLLTRLPFTQSLFDPDSQFAIPALKLGELNKLKFEFHYSNPIAGGTAEQCVSYQPVPNNVAIDESSTIDFSGYRHYMAMPNLHAFSQSAFPFSRMADLSETVVVMAGDPTAQKISTLLNTMGMIGAKTGYPAINVTLTDSWDAAKGKDADILFIGEMTREMADSGSHQELLLEKTKSWINMPMRSTPVDSKTPSMNDSEAASKTTIGSQGNIAAIVEFQSPNHEQRSVVALLADNPKSFSLLNDAIADTGKRYFVSGSVSVIRDSGINSVQVGKVYYSGYLPWWEKIWSLFASHPVLLSLLAVGVVIIFGLILWRIMKSISRRRLLSE